jgi:hypothetical protein
MESINNQKVDSSKQIIDYNEKLVNSNEQIVVDLTIDKSNKLSSNINESLEEIKERNKILKEQIVLFNKEKEIILESLEDNLKHLIKFIDENNKSYECIKNYLRQYKSNVKELCNTVENTLNVVHLQHELKQEIELKIKDLNKNKLKRKRKEIPEEEECVICKTFKANQQLFPCKHVVYCKRCVKKTIQKFGACPICRAVITKIEKVE